MLRERNNNNNNNKTADGTRCAGWNRHKTLYSRRKTQDTDTQDGTFPRGWKDADKA